MIVHPFASVDSSLGPALEPEVERRIRATVRSTTSKRLVISVSEKKIDERLDKLRSDPKRLAKLGRRVSRNRCLATAVLLRRGRLRRG